MESRKIICDNCQRDLTYTTDSVDWMLSLENRQIAYDPQAKHLSGVGYHPILKASLHFCGFSCLFPFLDKQREIMEAEQRQDAADEAKVAVRQ